jgi:hypothetical protein
MSVVSDIQHRHLLFRNRKKICRTENGHSDIVRVSISTSISFPISNILTILHHVRWIRTQDPSFHKRAPYLPATVLIYKTWMSDIPYGIKDYSDIRYNYGLCSLRSDIGSSDIKFSPISLVTDIGVSAHLWFLPVIIYVVTYSYIHILLIPIWIIYLIFIFRLLHRQFFWPLPLILLFFVWPEMS